jgi:hypothetical protein
MSIAAFCMSEAGRLVLREQYNLQECGNNVFRKIPWAKSDEMYSVSLQAFPSSNVLKFATLHFGDRIAYSKTKSYQVIIYTVIKHILRSNLHFNHSLKI